MSRTVYGRLNQLQKSTRDNLTASTVALSEKRSGDRKLVRLNLAGGQALVLPYATGKGGTYRLLVQTTYISSATVKVAATNNPKTGVADVFYGGVSISGTTPLLFGAAGAATITLNGTTTGGLKGSYLEIEDAAPGLWRVGGFLQGSGTAATPFS